MASLRRLNSWYGVLILVLVIFGLRLFYLQIIKHDYYQQRALSDQQREYTLTADRGTISAHSGEGLVPMALNQKRYTLFADPTLVKDAAGSAHKIAHIIGGRESDYSQAMAKADSRYQVLAKRLSHQQIDKINKLKLPGIASQAVNYRVYPQGNLAAPVLGFVNDDGKGNYGVEQYLNSELAGTPGRLKAITDVNGVPLAASGDNVEVDPQAGKNVVLTLDVGMQKQLEALLRQGLATANSDSGSAVVMDPYSGAVKALANWPTYDPAQYFKVKDPAVFNDSAVSAPLEVGSVMKVLTTAAALDQGVIKPTTTFYDPAVWHFDGFDIRDVAEDGGAGQRSIKDILQLSLNTGATWELMQMGGGHMDQQARERWHDYLVNHYQFGKLTGIEQGYESGGTVPDPDKGDALDLTYANTSFGQALTATPLQLAAALSSVVNGGTYYKPHLLDQMADGSGDYQPVKAKVIRKHVVKAKVGRDIRQLMQYVVRNHFFLPNSLLDRYDIGGKTGTPQIANPAGGYYTDRWNGTYIGYVGGRQPQYVIVIEVNQPHGQKYAGSGAAQPIFGAIAQMLINNFNVAPR